MRKKPHPCPECGALTYEIIYCSKDCYGKARIAVRNMQLKSQGETVSCMLANRSTDSIVPTSEPSQRRYR